MPPAAPGSSTPTPQPPATLAHAPAQPSEKPRSYKVGGPIKGKWKAFLKELSKCGNISAACRESGVDRKEAYVRRGEDPDFALAWEASVETGLDRQEEEADRRATRGVRTLLLFKGQPVRLDKEQGEHVEGWLESKDKDGAGLGWGFVYALQFSDALLTLLLKAGRPDKFADRKKVDAAITTPAGVAVTLTMADAISAARAARVAREANAPAPDVAPEISAVLGAAEQLGTATGEAMGEALGDE